jgi:hypothetical protein
MKKAILLAVLGSATIIPQALIAQDHDDHRFYDKRHKDYHQWNDHEDRAYHMYWEQRHHAYVDWARASEAERQRYWNWRHSHSDALLRIDIR